MPGQLQKFLMKFMKTLYEEFETDKSKRVESKEVSEELKKEKEMLRISSRERTSA